MGKQAAGQTIEKRQDETLQYQTDFLLIKDCK